MKLSTRLTLAMVALVLFTATAVAIFIYRDLEATILPQELQQLRSHSRQGALELEAYVRGARDDVLGNRGASMIASIVRAHVGGGIDPVDGSELSTWAKGLAGRLRTELEAKRSYLQFRLIGISDGGREVLRVERMNDGTIRLVPDDEMKRVGDQTFFKEATALGSGEVYFSKIELDRGENGLVFPYVPVMKIATLIQQSNGQPFGILVIDVDMAPAFERLRGNRLSGESLYVLDEDGNFLVHRDLSREFAFEFGKADRLQNEFPQLGDTLAAHEGEARTISDVSGNLMALAMASARFGHVRRIYVAEALRYSTIMAPVTQARWSLGLATLLACFAAIACAIFLSRSLSQPLVQITEAVRAFGSDQPLNAPTTAGGEIGMLARAFDQMATTIRSGNVKIRDYARRERFYIAAVESSNHAFLTMDPGGAITAWNPGAERMFGYSADEAVGQHITLIIPENRREESKDLRERIHRLERVENFETLRVAKDGRPLNVVLDAAPIKSRSGKMLGSAVVARDVTEQKVAQEMFRLAVESCPSGMVMYRADDRIVLVNTEMERLFGYSRDELIGRQVDLLVPNGLARHGDRTTALPVGHPARDVLGIRKDRSEFPVEIFLNPAPAHDEELMLAVIVDVSERRKNERLKDEFVSTVSHELRTPLTSIAGSLGLITGGATGAMPEPTMRFLRIAHKNSERLVRLINDILDIEKIESGKIVFDLKRVELRGLIEQAIDANRGYAENFDVSVTLDPDAEAAFVRADPDRLMQVVTNLLSNACKFSPPKQDVQVSIGIAQETVRIAVRDHGSGIPADFRSRIFEKFAQADATDARQKGGTGLGLSIVKQIVTLLGGTVDFRDVDGGGTEFFVDLPRWDRADGQAAAGAAAATTVLICDDDAAVADTIAERLEREGFVCDIALTAGETFKKAQTRDYRAVLVDLGLPDRDGISLIQDLRANPQHHNTPIVVISADAARGRNDIRSSSLDVLDWLNKPIDTGQLVEVLKRPLARNGGKRPSILHIDDDVSVREIVAEAIGEGCQVTSVATIDDARRAIADGDFDLAVLDLLLSQSSGLDLLPELRGRDGNAIPVILYSARAANGANAAQVQAALYKSHRSIDHLIDTLRKYTAGGHRLSAFQPKEVA